MTMMTLTKKRDLDKYAHVHKGKSLRVMTGCTTVFSSNHSYHHDDEVTRHQGYATRCNRFARKWKENEEMKRKWRENEEMERFFTLYISSFSPYFISLYPFPISNFVTFCRKMLDIALLSPLSQKT